MSVLVVNVANDPALGIGVGGASDGNNRGGVDDGVSLGVELASLGGIDGDTGGAGDTGNTGLFPPPDDMTPPPDPKTKIDGTVNGATSVDVADDIPTGAATADAESIAPGTAMLAPATTPPVGAALSGSNFTASDITAATEGFTD